MNIDEANDFVFWPLVMAAAVSILIKFNDYNCTIWLLHGSEIYICKHFYQQSYEDATRQLRGKADEMRVYTRERDARVQLYITLSETR